MIQGNVVVGQMNGFQGRDMGGVDGGIVDIIILLIEPRIAAGQRQTVERGLTRKNPDEAAKQRHEKGCPDTLVTHVGNHKAEAAAGNLKNVVKVAGHLAGRFEVSRRLPIRQLQQLAG